MMVPVRISARCLLRQQLSRGLAATALAAKGPRLRLSSLFPQGVPKHAPSLGSWSSSNCYSTTTHSATDDNDMGIVVYESPFGNLVGRLRLISLMTAVAGSVGLPAVIAIKGTMPSGGFLALCLSFGTGSLLSTAAIHYVFSPYVFYIERIPVRKCHFKNDGDKEPIPAPASQSYMYKAVTKSLFLTRIETIFDPNTDKITKYQGLTKPLCNMVVHDNIHLFVHAECVYDNALQKSLPLGKDGEPTSGRTTAEGKPARDKAADEDEAYHGY